MLPDIHTDSIRDNQTGAEGMVTQRQIYRYGKGYKKVFGKLNKATVVHICPFEGHFTPDELLTLEQYHAKQAVFDEAFRCANPLPI